jgi:hypothetical protein
MPKYLLIQHYEDCETPMGTWEPADIRAHIDYQHALNDELAAAGELLEAQGVARDARLVVSDGATRSVGTPAQRRRLAGYRVVDVESEDRALEIAARTSAAPGPRGAPIQQPIEVRQIMVAPGPAPVSRS